MPLFSVIIPVYKVEKYLRKCVDSVLNQYFEDIELILVNDGSPDLCPRICDEYKQSDARVKVIHKKNGGLSDARNAGIKKACGKYLIFLDSDDYWDSADALTNIVEKTNKEEFDVLLFGCKDHSCLTGETRISRTGYDHTLISNGDKKEVLNYLFSSGLFPGSAWITVTKRSFILENNIFFISDIKAEDIDWLLNVFINANSYSSTDDTFYIYLKHRNDSITGTADIKSIEDILYTLDKWEGRIKVETNVNLKRNMYSYLSYHYLITFIIYSNLSSEKKLDAAQLINKYKYLLSYSNSKKIKLIRFLLNIFGLRIMSRFFSTYYQLKKL